MTRAPFVLLCASALPLPAAVVERAEVLKIYADFALAIYGDSLTGARDLQRAVEALLAAPLEETLSASRAAWIASRAPYMQTEAFRFGNPIADDWEGQVNALPLDEGLIDDVDSSYGGATEANDYLITHEPQPVSGGGRALAGFGRWPM